MPRPPLYALTVIAAMVLIAGLLALNAPYLNVEEDRARALIEEITLTLAEMRAQLAAMHEYSAISEGHMRAGANPWGLFLVAPSRDGLRIRLTRIPDQACRALLAAFPQAAISVIKDQDDVVIWHGARQKNCDRMDKNGARLNAIELLF